MTNNEKARRERQRQASKQQERERRALRVKEDQRRVLRLRAVMAVTGLSRSAIYERVAVGAFPQPIPLGVGPQSRAVGWLAAEIDQWLDARIAERDARLSRVA